jgi:hypothetical protein
VIVHKNKAGLEPTKIPTAIDIAWSAGIYEGEGSCVVSGGNVNTKSFSICVPQKDPEFLYRLRDWFGGGIKLYNVGKERRFEIYHWVVCGDNARAFVAVVYPFLTSRRRAQIDATRASIFLEYAKDLLSLEDNVQPCERFLSIRSRVVEFHRIHRELNDKKRYEYLKNYYQTPEYKEKSRLKAANRRQQLGLKKQKQLQIVEIKKTA